MAKLIEIVGSLNIDLVTVTARVPGPGETLTASSFSTGFGGKGANQAVACARLLRAAPGAAPTDSVRVRMIGAVGDDQFGLDFRSHMEREGLCIDAVQIKKSTKTGTAVILVEENTGENRILLSPGANGVVKPIDIVLNTNQSEVVIFQLEIPLATVIETIEYCKQQGKIVILNPAPAIALPDVVYDGLDHLILNESEAAILSGTAEDELSENLDQVAASFLQRGVRNLVVTLGSKGVYWKSLDLGTGQANGGFVAAHEVTVVDTTAAGDTFVGGYAVWLTTNSRTDVEGAVRFANRAASLAVQKSGAQTSIPFLKEVQKL